MKKPVAVLTSDIHFSLSTLDLATAVFKMALEKAAKLKVPLYDLGDITNDKANLRAEVMNELLALMHYAKNLKVPVTLLVGNHSLINERSEANALEFLSPYAYIASEAQDDDGIILLPYQSNSKDITRCLELKGSNKLIFAHQGLTGALPGHYTMDHSAVSKTALPANITVFSGHYHNGQTINLPNGGTWTYVGNPYTLTFGEANDTPKGFIVLYDDNSFDRIPCNLRKHVVAERTIETVKDPIPNLNPDDLLWLKVKGTATELAIVYKD